MSEDDENKVLSIQSTVVSGYVGNKCATFALQLLGFDVCPMNSVQLSNHTGYKCFKGQVLNSNDVDSLYSGLKENKINNQFSHLITGYIGSKSFLEKVGEIIQDLRDQNKGLIYVCDPVMGDSGKMYVPADLLPVYRDVIVPKADIVTPNQYEAELLTDMKISSQDDALKAMEILHNKGPKTVVLSSTSLGSENMLVGLASTRIITMALKAMEILHNKGPKTVVLSSTSLGSEKVLVGLASTRINGHKECYRIEMNYLNAIFVGTGDLFASCLMAWMSKHNDLKIALEKTVATVQAVIQRTLAAAKKAAGPDQKPSPAQMELRLIQSKRDIESPTIEITATQIH